MAVEGGCIAASPEPDDDALLEEFQTNWELDKILHRPVS
jgi:hypothetical protein